MGVRPFTLILDDPVGISDILDSDGVTSAKAQQSVVTREDYNRTWQQCAELDLTRAFEIDPQVRDDLYPPDSSHHNIAGLVHAAKRVAVFSGAGISTESGIPAFWVDQDDKKGIWSTYDHKLFTLANITSRPDVTRKYWQMKCDMFAKMCKAEPSPAHDFFAELHSQGKLAGVITQNIDRLHSKAGVPLEKIAELHGNMFNIHCVTCDKLFDSESVFNQLELRRQKLSTDEVAAGVDPPVCDACGCAILPDTLPFGAKLSSQVLAHAERILHECDLLFIVGTSLLVQPANKLPGIAVLNRTPVVILNKTPTPYDAFAAVISSDACGATLTQVTKALREIDDLNQRLAS